jgi:hypothetical protein
VVSTECQVAVVSLTGSVSTTAQAHECADRVLDVVSTEGPVVVDLSRLAVAPDELAWLVLRFEATPQWHRFRLVDDRIGQRRRLRALCRRVPVLPDVATALAGARTEVPADTPELEIVDLWGGVRPDSASTADPAASADRSDTGHPSRSRSDSPRG